MDATVRLPKNSKDNTYPLEFFKYASKLNSSLHEKQENMLIFLQSLKDRFSSFFMIEIAPVGSCLDRSKVRTDGDNGDIDILFISHRVSFDQSQFEYDKEYPGFVHILAPKDESQLLFKHVKLIKRKYYPVCILKQLNSAIFFMVSYFVRLLNLSEKGVAKVSRHSAVGLENTEYDIKPLLKTCSHSNCINDETNNVGEKVKVEEMFAEVTCKMFNKIFEENGLTHLSLSQRDAVRLFEYTLPLIEEMDIQTDRPNETDKTQYVPRDTNQMVSLANGSSEMLA